MSELGVIGLLIGLAAIAGGALAFQYPEGCVNALAKFPRSRWPGWVLTAGCLVWVAWVVYHAALGRFSYLKPLIPFATPVAFWLVIVYMDELLAPRALGGLLMLIANPVLNAARWVDTPWRWVLTVLAYCWVVAGILLMLNPARFRRWSQPMATVPAMRKGGMLKIACGIGILCLAIWVY